MNNQEKKNLITRHLAETLTEEELDKLLESNTPLKHYIGFEISGKLHIGYLFQLMKVKDIQDAGGETVIWLADLHSAINDKLDGNLETIKRMAYEYFIPAMESLFECIGGDPKKLIFKLCSEEYAKHPKFWLTFLEMAKSTSLARSKRSITIMGREEAEDNMATDKIMYPIMQAADIFLLQVNIAQAGIDQRKVHVVARDSAMQIKTNPLKNVNGSQIKPVAIHMPTLLGLNHPLSNISPGEILTRGSDTSPNIIRNEGSIDEDNRDIAAMRLKMSKSKPGSGITIHDIEEEIKEKIKNAYAPEVENKADPYEINPLLNWTKYLVFYNETKFILKRDPKWGGDKTYSSYDQLEDDYVSGSLSREDLKNNLAKWLISKLSKVREYFEDPKRKAALEEITNLTQK